MHFVTGMIYRLKSFVFYGWLAVAGLIAPRYAERSLMRIAIRFCDQMEAGPDYETLKIWARCGS